MPERLNGAVLKTADRGNSVPGFESQSSRSTMRGSYERCLRPRVIRPKTSHGNQSEHGSPERALRGVASYLNGTVTGPGRRLYTAKKSRSSGTR